MQTSKTIYFPDYPSSGPKRSGLTIPFSIEDAALYDFIKPLSSHTIRNLIGFDRYELVEAEANRRNASIAALVRDLIRLRAEKDDSSSFYEIQSTFRGGKGSPLHDWYPYLEGYSPEFVASIVEKFTPDARDILDPFCGSGTTALVAAIRGGKGFYCEVNPVCQYIIEAKSIALTLSVKERHRVASVLSSQAQELSKALASRRPDQELAASFTQGFGTRPFFDASNFDAALRTRTLVDELGRNDPLAARFLTVAALRALVPSSLLVRRGDLRFRTEKELERGVARFEEELRSSLELIASDLIDTQAAPGRTQFVTDDARRLSTHMQEHVDAVITSPPYLNGTNYFRNTKIELWFLRKLSTKEHLRAFRDAAITSGINDVTQSKLIEARAGGHDLRSDRLKGTLDEIGKRSYDQRIPAMIENYFYDMHQVIAAIPTILKPNGIVCIDLGDSMYGGVHVPTHDILAELMDGQGFALEKTVVLRERQSRDGAPLSQTLQVFSLQSKNAPRSVGDKPKLERWNRFKSELPHQKGDMARRNWGHSWHSMCSYQGKLKPSIASCLVDALMPARAGRLLDTFSGVGTIPFEARLKGHTAFGFDISPAAIAISRAKLEFVDWQKVDQVLNSLANYIQRYGARVSIDGLEYIRFNGPLPSYFHPKTLQEIVAARRFFMKNKPSDGATALVFASLLHVLHGNRPYALSRRSHPITPFAPTGPTEYRSLIEKVAQKVERCRKEASTLDDTGSKSFAQDVTAPWPHEVRDLDAIITSPPFFDSTRFHTANWMRLWFAGWEQADFMQRPKDFVDERQKSSFELYDAIFRQANERLVRGGMFAVHVGKSTKCDMAAALQQIGTRHLHFVDWFSESVEHCESHGIRDKGTVTHHQYLLFEKATD